MNRQKYIQTNQNTKQNILLLLQRSRTIIRTRKPYERSPLTPSITHCYIRRPRFVTSGFWSQCTRNVPEGLYGGTNQRLGTKGHPERWQELFESDLHFVLMEDNRTKEIAGFSSINARGYLHSLFVQPAYQHRGIGLSLLRAAEEFARTHRTDSIYSEVSKTAKPFFEANGYGVEKEQTVTIGRIQMNNFMMKKIFLQKTWKQR